MIEEHNPPSKQLKRFFTLATNDSPARSHMPVVIRPLEIKHFLIQMLLLFYGLELKSPFKHIDAFL